MRIIVATCDSYSDALPPFLELFRKFWPDCPYPLSVVSDSSGRPENWCPTIIKIAEESRDEPTLIFQEDLWLTHPVETELVEEGLALLLSDSNIGCCRLFPCPGSPPGEGNFGLADRQEPYHVSIQASIWRPRFLKSVAKLATGGRAADFELEGGVEATRTLPDQVMAFRRGLWPWPVQYLCAAIRNGRWIPEARELAELHAIPVDWSRRPFIGGG